eukprot:PITA_16570
MCLMNSVLSPYLDNFVIVFIDEILVYSKNEEEHVEHLAVVLRLLREHQLYAKLNKCNFFQTEVHNLGHVVSKDGIAVDPKKTRAITKWVAPRSVDERKGKKFEWTEECATSFEQLKQFLTHAALLKIADLDKEFVVCTGACKRGLGGVLMQYGQIDGQRERVNRILEDMLRMYVVHQKWKWEEYLLLVEFTYNNGYLESLRRSPFEALYGKSCNTPISWSGPVNRVLIGLDMLTDMEREMPGDQEEFERNT